MATELKQNENWKERFIEQKNQLANLNQTIEDLQTRLQISLQSHSELEKKHKEEIDQINSQRISETVYLKANFSKKENQQNETISNLREEIKILKMELSNSNQKFLDLQKRSNNLEKEQTKEIVPTPFSIQIPIKDSELKWKNRYKKEKEKKEKLKDYHFQQQKIIDEKQQKIENLEKEIEEKQNTINSLQIQQQTETSTIIQSLQQKIDDFQSQATNSFSNQETQKKFIQQSNNSMDLELASFLTNQNEIHNKKINSLSIKLSKSIQIINEMKDKNEKLISSNYQLKDKIKQISFIQDDLNNALFENQEKDRIIKKIGKKINLLRSKNKVLKNIIKELQQNQKTSQSNQVMSNSSEIEDQNNSSAFNKFLSIFDSHQNEINNMLHSNSQSIPTNLLPPELLSEFSGSELKIERIIEWYNNKIKLLKNDSKQLRIMKNIISSCFTNVQFNMESNKIFCEQVRNEINSLKDKLRELTLKQQQLQLSTLGAP